MEPEGRINRQMEQEGGMNFTVGQEVWSTLYGKGIVISVGEHPGYPIKVKFEESYATFTEEGVWDEHEGPSLFPYPVKVVPADIPDYPFMLEGKPVSVGVYLDYWTIHNEKRTGKVESLILSEVGPTATFLNNDYPYRVALHRCAWPLPEPPKRWAYLIAGMPGPMSIGFTDPMPESEAREKYGQVWEVPEGEI